MTIPLSIPQTDPKANYLKHRNEIDGAVARVCEGGWYILGDEVTSFEREFAAYVGTRHGIGVGNGTDALQIALWSCGIGKGDLVIVPAHTAVATVAAVELCQATPVLVDIDPTTLTIDPSRIDQASREFSKAEYAASHGRLKAIIAVHLYGHPADMEAIISIAEQYGLHVIEDCAQSHGAVYRGRRTGGWGNIAAFSFYPTKNLGALGDGGMIVTDDAQLAARAKLLREYGWRSRYISEVSGMNSRLDELQAAILRVKLPHLDEENLARQRIASSYDVNLKATSLTLPHSLGEVSPVYHQYVVRHSNRDALRVFLRQRGIGTLVHYPLAIHMQPAYRGRIPSFGSLENSEEATGQVLSLPLYPELHPEKARVVAEAIAEWDGARTQ